MEGDKPRGMRATAVNSVEEPQNCRHFHFHIRIMTDFFAVKLLVWTEARNYLVFIYTRGTLTYETGIGII